MVSPVSPTSRACVSRVSLFASGMGKRVLFVDDDKDWRAMVQTALTDGGHSVMTATDATDAWTKFEYFKPELVIVDLNLAGESGLMLIKFLKQNNPEAKIMIYTGVDQDGDGIMNALEQGAHHYVRKGAP